MGEIAWSITQDFSSSYSETNYQPAIRAARNWKPGADTLFRFMAELVPEPTNPMTETQSRLRSWGLGHLFRQDAVALGPVVCRTREQRYGQPRGLSVFRR
jgi:hypothetical protein